MIFSLISLLISDEISRGEAGLGGGAQTGAAGEFQFENLMRDERSQHLFPCQALDPNNAPGWDILEQTKSFTGLGFELKII